MTQRINGKQIARTIESDLKQRIEQLKEQGKHVTLAVVLVGDDKPSHSYVRQKERAAKRVGMQFKRHYFTADISQKELVQEIQKIQQSNNLSGMIVQLPLPDHIDTTAVLNSIDSRIDVDCLGDIQQKQLLDNRANIVPPTPGAMLSILDHIGVDPKEKQVVIFGAGLLVGAPLKIILEHAGANVQVITQKTTQPKQRCQQADIVMSGVGKKGLISAEMIKKGAIIIDAGVDYDNEGKMYGDVDIESVDGIASYVTPTPGGVGPVTVARLLLNTVVCAEGKQSKAD